MARAITMLAAGLEVGMRRCFVGAVGLLAVVLSLACSGGDNGNRFPDDVRRGFLNTCKDSGGSEKQCTCALEKLEAKYRLKEFQDLERRITSGDAAAEAELAPVVASCR
jgi:hypothetical protein